MECRGWRSAAERYERQAKRERCAASAVQVAPRELTEFFASDDWQAASWLLDASKARPIKIARKRVLAKNGIAEMQHFLNHEGIQSFIVFGGESRKCACAPEEVVRAWACSWGASVSDFLPWLYQEIDRVRDEAPKVASQWAWH